jgi:hypothetical protein
LDFTRTRCDPFLALLALNKIENASLSLGQHVILSFGVARMQVQMNMKE